LLNNPVMLDAEGNEAGAAGFVFSVRYFLIMPNPLSI